MTKKERKEPQLFKKQKTRILRVANGSGTDEKDVRELLNQFEKLSGLVGGVKKNRGMRKKMEKFMSSKNLDMDKMNGLMSGGHGL
jgi:signal recognition particle subunit SRP54